MTYEGRNYRWAECDGVSTNYDLITNLSIREGPLDHRGRQSCSVATYWSLASTHARLSFQILTSRRSARSFVRTHRRRRTTGRSTRRQSRESFPRRHGLTTLPKRDVSFDEPIANSSMLSLPNINAPSLNRLAVTVLS